VNQVISLEPDLDIGVAKPIVLQKLKRGREPHG